MKTRKKTLFSSLPSFFHPVSLLLTALLALPGFSRPEAKISKNPLVAAEVHTLVNADFEQEKQGWRSAGKVVSGVGRKHSKALVLGPKDRGYAYQNFAVKRYKKYYVTAWIKVTGEDVAGSFRVVSGASGEPESRKVLGNWQQVGVLFTGTSKNNISGHFERDEAACQIRLKRTRRGTLSGKGKVLIDDIRVYQLRNYEPWLRIKLLSDTPGHYALSTILQHGQSPDYTRHQQYLEKMGLRAGEFSPWLPFGPVLRNLTRSNRIACGLSFLPIDGPPLKQVKAQIDFAWRAPAGDPIAPEAKKMVFLKEIPLSPIGSASLNTDDTGKDDADEMLEEDLAEAAPKKVDDPNLPPAILRTITLKRQGNILGLYLPGPATPPQEFAARFGLIIDDARRRNQHAKSLGLNAAVPKKFFIEAHLSGLGRLYSDPAVAEIEVDTIRRLGFSALDTQYAGLAQPFRGLAQARGINATHQVFRTFGSHPPSGLVSGTLPLDWPLIERHIDKTWKTMLSHWKNADPGQLAPIKYVDVGDEIAGFLFSGPAWEASYREYVKKQGISPADLGTETWQKVKPNPPCSWRNTAGNRPANLSDLPACRRYYWSLRFWNENSARLYAMVAKRVQRDLPGRDIRINYGTSMAYGYSTYLRGAELWTYARHHSSAIWQEDWLNLGSWRHAGIQLVSYLTDLSRSVAQAGGVGFGSYLMPVGREIELKIMAAVGRGSKYLNIYRYGPRYASNDSWSDNLNQAEGVAAATRKIARAEDMLLTAKPVRTNVAMLWSGSEPVWAVDSGPTVDFRLVYLALLHAQIHVDFVDEFMVEAGALKKYDILVATAPHVRRATQQKIAEWVKQGGALWADAGAFSGDEYGQAGTVMNPVLGIAKRKLTRALDPTGKPPSYDPYRGLTAQKPVARVTLKNGASITAVGWRADVTLINSKNTSVQGTFKTGKPAIFTHHAGRGQTQFVGFLAGCAYSRPCEYQPGKIKTGYRQKERAVITDFVIAAGANRPVQVSEPMVQADLLVDGTQAALVLTNFSGAPVPTLTVSLPPAVAGKSIKSVTLNRLALQRRDKLPPQVKLKIKRSDILLFTLNPHP